MAVALVFPRATPALVKNHAPPGARLVAIDAGAEALRTLDLVPERIVGDMDSVSPGTLEHYSKMGVRVERHPQRKRDTDGTMALRPHLAEEEIVFLGPGGGRADHALANLHLLVAAGGRARAVDADAYTWVATPQRPLHLARPVGTTLSVLPFDARCLGVTYEGLEYPLSDAAMEAGEPYGMSNVCSAPRQRISVGVGRLVVIEPRSTTHE